MTKELQQKSLILTRKLPTSWAKIIKFNKVR